jgi:uncharacterized 2Fe-2S/4Fe-4S cluster protein (DUF4445 family)
MKREPQHREVAVSFEPHGKKVFVLPGTSLLEAASRAGLTLKSPCGGNGTCGKCRVRVLEGLSPAEPGDAEAIQGPLTGGQLADGERLACVTHVRGPMTVEVPEDSLAGTAFNAIGSDGEAELDAGHTPVVKKFVDVEPPTLEDSRDDGRRLGSAFGGLSMDLGQLRRLAEREQPDRYRGTLVAAGSRLVAWERGDTAGSHLAAAFDLGTTTIAGSLLDLAAGCEIASTTRLNPQSAYGDDVLARISHASSCGTCLQDLQQMAVGAINQMTAEMAGRAGRRVEEVYDVVLAGNTTMQHLLVGVNPECLGRVPFAPVFAEALEVPAGELRLHAHNAARAYLFPSIGGFVGGDTVACIVSTRLQRMDPPVLLVDVGTNGEIVLAGHGGLIACSTAAGPAFEGARIRHGMHACSGAIEKVAFRDGEVLWNVIGNVAPVGICGSALLDVAAELRRSGLLEETGRLLGADDLPAGLPPGLAERVIEGSDGPEFVIAGNTQSRTGEPITLTQKDLREMQLAVAAIRAGITILLEEAGVRADQLKSLLLAGGFGNYIRRSNAQAVGLLPLEVQRSRIRFIGNASLAGAKRAAVSSAAREAASRIAGCTRHLNISRHPDFQNIYAEAMMLPDLADEARQKERPQSRRLKPVL